MTQQECLKILLVEDSLVSQKVVLRQLKKLGYEANVAANGQEALWMRSQVNYDLILLDCQMPILDGYETAKKIRQLEGDARQIIVIAMTANGMKANWERCLNAGMDDYLLKPVSEEELAAKLEKWSQNITKNKQKIASASIELAKGFPPVYSSNDIDESSIDNWVDLNRLDDITLGDMRLRKEILQAFLEDTKANLLSIKSATLSKNFDSIEHKAHQIRGASANVGVNELKFLANQLEFQSQQKNFKEVTDLVLQIEHHFQKIQSFFFEIVDWDKLESETPVLLAADRAGGTQVRSLSKILIIDDDPSVRLVIKNSLQLLGHEVIVATNGEEGLAKAKELYPHLIICDWMMPVINGLEVCRQVKSDPELSLAFFILLTIRGDVKDRVEGLDTGADEYLPKPIDMSELRARVGAGLRLQRLTRELSEANQALRQVNQQLTARNELLESLSLTDQLTGLLNRRAMDQALPHMLRQVGNRDANTRYRYLCVFLIDVDHFKGVNDTYGHTVGDCVLQAIAGRLQSNARPSSLLYRYGGEEFVCITLGLNLHNGLEYGESLRSCIADRPFKISNDLLLPITISLGGAIASAVNLVDSQDLLHQADRALYRAKHEGRNCLRMFSAWENIVELGHA
ncbi:response regulator [Coleofasciculus sp. FACHB-1120]|uniref:response regulator n=1 Tax=Coleofasciculus sp. FACHB-1120 TaxID=2692783 RepID=UPI001681E9E9|nr:response regulator [Coleofasciculus sp. FACHB-1120]MBD2740455.1 response regulator [Coleofasciculus sp. FACHB-1120]